MVNFPKLENLVKVFQVCEVSGTNDREWSNFCIREMYAITCVCI